jgi:hypothetical protein
LLKSNPYDDRPATYAARPGAWLTRKRQFNTRGANPSERNHRP